jgi:hypothetical protein
MHQFVLHKNFGIYVFFENWQNSYNLRRMYYSYTQVSQHSNWKAFYDLLFKWKVLKISATIDH